MKKTLSILFLLVSLKGMAQKKDTTDISKKYLPYYIEVCKDIMTNITYAFGSKNLMCAENNQRGFGIIINWHIDASRKIKYEGITVVSAGIGGCVENSSLIFLFDDDSKIDLKAWTNFNCEGQSIMDLGGKQFESISSKKVKAIRFQNGRTMDYYTYQLKNEEQSYFLEAATALRENKIVNGICNF